MRREEGGCGHPRGEDRPPVGRSPIQRRDLMMGKPDFESLRLGEPSPGGDLLTAQPTRGWRSCAQTPSLRQRGRADQWKLTPQCLGPPERRGSAPLASTLPVGLQLNHFPYLKRHPLLSRGAGILGSPTACSSAPVNTPHPPPPLEEVLPFQWMMGRLGPDRRVL